MEAEVLPAGSSRSSPMAEETAQVFEWNKPTDLYWLIPLAKWVIIPPLFQ